MSDEAAGIIERSRFESAGYSIDLWVMRPRRVGRFPVLIYNHGSRMQADGRIDRTRQTLSFEAPVWRGVSTGQCAVIFPEGRGYGASTGPALESCVDWQDVWTFLQGRAADVVASVEWLADQDWADPTRILLSGCSHGGIVSLFAQADLAVRGTIAQAPAVGDHSRDMVGSDLVRVLDRSKAPILLQHAEHDLHAPIEFSRSFQRQGNDRGKDVRLCVYPFRPTVSSHDQFDWRNRDIWGPDFDYFACETLGLNGHLVCNPS